MFNVGNTYMGMASSSSSRQSTGDFGCFDNYTRKDNVLLTTCTDEGASNLGDVGGVDNEKGIKSEVDLIWELDADGSKIVLFF